MSNGKIQAVALVFIVLVIAGVAAASRNYERSGYCGSCHSMAPYYESWQASNHASVECVGCHTGPGVVGWARGKADLVRMIRAERAGGATTFDVETGDEFCMGCHPQAKSIKESETVKVSHAVHDAIGLDCSSCHGGQIHGEDGGPPTTITHDTCDMCHAEEIDDYDLCSKCHKW
ncbi:MAG: NapC/NirT family cytochrome c [Firmicutes bacterium]|nr:NapC/NirT family cytochrome c [Bacillota bacterium]